MERVTAGLNIAVTHDQRQGRPVHQDGRHPDERDAPTVKKPRLARGGLYAN